MSSATATASAPLTPTFTGYVDSTIDALVLFEACLSGQLMHIPRRPHDRERAELIRSGSVFIYEEHSSGIKRWTDGVSWSPSRILKNFLLYRELDKPFAPGEKKRALKKKSPQQGVTKNASSRPMGHSPTMGPRPDEPHRDLVGSLVDSYDFKQDGLLKKTISISYRNVAHHLVSYYSVDDVQKGRLPRPYHVFPSTTPRPELFSQNFRAPIEEEEFVVTGYAPPAPPQHLHQTQPQPQLTEYMPQLDYINRTMNMANYTYSIPRPLQMAQVGGLTQAPESHPSRQSYQPHQAHQPHQPQQPHQPYQTPQHPQPSQLTDYNQPWGFMS